MHHHVWNSSSVCFRELKQMSTLLLLHFFKIVFINSEASASELIKTNSKKTFSWYFIFSDVYNMLKIFNYEIVRYPLRKKYVTYTAAYQEDLVCLKHLTFPSYKFSLKIFLHILTSVRKALCNINIYIRIKSRVQFTVEYLNLLNTAINISLRLFYYYRITRKSRINISFVLIVDNK